ncbi:MAG: UDP-N-acetylglucosamine 4,6-dehydratase (inverting), partial [candidate division Zixibacteria bacterium]|nr:UDP-N-acetylglucosamine 4,6-dehydratase (inverting) [candidate division Zixibacteria bacterium]
TGGTGSFGKEFTRTVLTKYPGIKRLVIYSRDELKQFEMGQQFSETEYPQLRYFIGDVRDKERLYRALEGIDMVVHAAALKQVPAAEYNPFEAVKTNIIGAQNVIECSIDRNIEKVVALSTDKAAAPINLYGATKLCSDKMFVAANNFKGDRLLKLSVVRYGNVMGSRGSVVPFFLKKRADGVLPITDARMTRFNITLTEGVNLVLYAFANMWGGEIYVPKIPSYHITDLAKAIAPHCRQKTVGIRPGEKLHEEMITETDAINSLEFEHYFVILPSMNLWDVPKYMETFKGRRCAAGFSYSSGTNDRWLSVDQLRRLIKADIDPTLAIPVPPARPEGRRTLSLKSMREDLNSVAASGAKQRSMSTLVRQ